MKFAKDRARASQSVVLSLLASTLLLPLAVPAHAQVGAIVQPVPQSGAVERLNQNLNRLSRQPTDMEALIGAGMASYELGDAQAANGFFMRADMANPQDGRAKLGLALVSVALRNPAEAATYFDEADALGVHADSYLYERALAYDLTGQQDKAQRDYALAIRARPDNVDLTRAYAVSLGISGKLPEAEALLRPLLFQSNRAAWRDRTMILAMNGRTNEARRIAQTIMPRQLADAMDPYLIRMGSLNAAQKAAAAFYGQFPADGLRLPTVTSPPAALAAAARAEGEANGAAGRRRPAREQRGRTPAPAAVQQPAPSAEDSSLLAAMPHAEAPPPAAAPPPAQVAMAQPAPARPAADASGNDDPDGWTANERRQAERRVAARPPQPVPVTPAPAAPVPAAPVSRQPAATPAPAPVPRVAAPLPTPVPRAVTPAPSPAPVPVVTARGPADPGLPRPAPVTQAPAPVLAATPAPTPTPVPAPTPAPAPAAPPPRTLAAIMADIQVPDAERAGSAQGVDLAEVAQIQADRRRAAADRARREAAAKAKAEADARARAEAEERARLRANPARVWVQIATGRDPAALAFDLRRMRRIYAALGGQDGFTAEWGQTRRLLIGPYTAVKARAVLADLKKQGGEGFVFESEAGDVVSPLSSGR